ncbi:hypothetical protein ACWDYH_15390 [Nocardia goodfellowii]
MTQFDMASYESVIKEIEDFLKTIDDKIKIDVPNARDDALDLTVVKITPGLKSLVKTCANKMSEILKWLWDKIVEIGKGIRAPIDMWNRSREWNEVNGTASSVSSTIDVNNLTATRIWKGAAALSYQKTATSQSAATKTIGDIADKIKTALEYSAGAAFAFYVAVTIIVGKFLIALVSEIMAMASGIGAGAGLAGVVATSGITSAELWAAVGLLVTVMGTQVKAMIDAEATLNMNSGFTREGEKVNWPASQAATFSDASVDGDNESKWRLNG